MKKKLLWFFALSLTGCAPAYAAGPTSGIVEKVFVQSGSGAVPRQNQAKLREAVSVADFGARGDGSDETAKFTAAQAAAAFIEVPAGMKYKVGAGLNYWQFYGRGEVSENGKQWMLAPYPQAGSIAKAYVGRTFGTYEQAVGSSITINAGTGQTKENTQVLGTDTRGLAQSYPDRDHVAQYLSASSFTPDVLDATTTYTATTVTNAAISALNTAGKIKPGMVIDTQHSDIATGRVQSVAGNVITVDAWYARSGGVGMTPANSVGAIVNPNNKIFGQNIVVTANGNGTTTGAAKFSGVELDLFTGASGSPRSGTFGFDTVVMGGGYIDVGYQMRGKRNISYFSNNAGGAGLYGFYSVGDARGLSINDPSTQAIEVITGGALKYNVDNIGNVVTVGNMNVGGNVIAGGQVVSTGIARLNSAGIVSVTFSNTATPTGISTNAGGLGQTIMALVSGQGGAGANTCSSIYMIRTGYDGNNFTATKIAGDDGGMTAGSSTMTFSQVGGQLHIQGPAAISYSATFFSNRNTTM
jgi:hypothetical protein